MTLRTSLYLYFQKPSSSSSFLAFSPYKRTNQRLAPDNRLFVQCIRHRRHYQSSDMIADDIDEEIKYSLMRGPPPVRFPAVF